MTGPAILTRTGSHSVTFPAYNPSELKEEVYAYLDATWRGRPVKVTMRADRYTHSSGLSDWRIYASEAREVPGPSQYLGANLTDTARRALSDLCRPLVAQWIASPEYGASEEGAYRRALARHIRELRPWEDATRDVVKAAHLLFVAGKISFETAEKVGATCSAFDAYTARMIELDQ